MHTTPQLQLHLILHQPNLLPHLESRQPHIRTSIAPKRIPQRAIPATAYLPLYREVHLGELLRLEFCERGVGVGAFGGVFGGDAGGEATGAIFAGAAAFSRGGAAFGCCWAGREG